MQSITGRPREPVSAQSTLTIPNEKEDEASTAIDRNVQELPRCSYLKSYEQKLQHGTQVIVPLEMHAR